MPDYSFSSAELTFGVEFEFAIAFDGWSYGHDDFMEYVKDVLRAATGFSVFCASNPHLHRRDILPEHAFSGWDMAYDGSLIFEEEESDTGIDHFAMELQTPCFNFSREAFEQIEKMLIALNSEFEIVINETCGVHVHVGRANKGFEPGPLQNLMSTLWTFENHISTLHPECRSNNSLSLHGQSNFALKANRLKEGDLVEFILRPMLHNDVVHMWSGQIDYLRMAYCVLLLRKPFPHDMKRTIEFRQHAGTNDSKSVLHWVTFIVELVAWCHRQGPGEMREFLGKYINLKPEEFQIEDLFENIRLTKATSEFYKAQLAASRSMTVEEFQDFYTKKMVYSVRDMARAAICKKLESQESPVSEEFQDFYTKKMVYSGRDMARAAICKKLESQESPVSSKCDSRDKGISSRVTTPSGGGEQLIDPTRRGIVANYKAGSPDAASPGGNSSGSLIVGSTVY